MTTATTARPEPCRKALRMDCSMLTGLSHRSSTLRQLITSYVMFPSDQPDTSKTLQKEMTKKIA